MSVVLNDRMPAQTLRICPPILSLHKAGLMDSTPEGWAGSGRGRFSELEPPGPPPALLKVEPSLSASFLTPLSNCDGRAWPQAGLVSHERHPGDGFMLALASREQVVAAAEEICSWAPEAQPGWAPRASCPFSWQEAQGGDHG